MISKILSLNIGGPEKIEFEGRAIVTSMHKRPVEGPLNVYFDRIEGNSFASPEYHGGHHAILYIFGMSSAREFVKNLGERDYLPGSTGETLTVDEFDEKQVSVGDVFQIGEVLAQATYPRIPCGKVSIRMKNVRGQAAMIESGRSGVYLRILKEGLIKKEDSVVRIEKAKVLFSIFELYGLLTKKTRPANIFSSSEFERVLANGAFPEAMVENWKELRSKN